MPGDRVSPEDGRTLVVAARSEKRVVVARVPMPPTRDLDGSIVLLGPIAQLPEMDDWVLQIRLLTPPRAAIEQGLGTAARWGWVAVGFAHNFVEIWNWGRGGVKIRRVVCEDQPVLMCMALHGDAASSLAVAAAGFTRQVVVWSLPADDPYAKHVTGGRSADARVVRKVGPASCLQMAD